MRNCYNVPAEAWRQLRDTRWEKLKRAYFPQCLGRGGGCFFGFPAFFMWRGGAASAVPPPHGAFPTCKNRRPRCFNDSSQGVEGADILLAALARCSALQDTTRRRSCSGLWIQTRPLTRLAPIRPFSGLSGAHRGMFSILAMETTRS